MNLQCKKSIIRPGRQKLFSIPNTKDSVFSLRVKLSQSLVKEAHSGTYLKIQIGDKEKRYAARVEISLCFNNQLLKDRNENFEGRQVEAIFWRGHCQVSPHQRRSFIFAKGKIMDNILSYTP